MFSLLNFSIIETERKGKCLFLLKKRMAPQSFLPSRLPANPHLLLLLSIPRTVRSDHRKSFLCRCLKNEKTAFLSSNKKAVFAVFALLGVRHPRWGDFEKSALKSPETRMNTKKNRGDIYFVTPSWEGVTKLLSAGLIPFGINLLNKNQKELPTK